MAVGLLPIQKLMPLCAESITVSPGFGAAVPVKYSQFLTAAPGAVTQRGLVAQISQVPGIRATSALDHSYAYVGPDLQDTYGIDPATIAKATTLRDSYFLGAGSAQMLARLRARPDAILVSKETISDYSLRL